MSEDVVYVTVVEAAAWTRRGERTIRRWMNLGLLEIFKRGDGLLVLRLDEVNRVERAQASRNPVRTQRRDQRFAQVRSMAYPRD